MSLFENAQLIWRNAVAQNDEYADFIASFEAKEGASYTLKIASDSNYVLFINGKLCEFGQYADYPDYRIADVIDITKHLSKGENLLCFTVWYYGLGTSTYTHGEASLIFEIFEDGVSVLWSNENTLSRLSGGYVSHEARLISGQLGFTYHFDAKAYDGLYESGKGEGFAKSRLVFGERPNFFLRPVKKLLLKDRIDGKICLEGIFSYDKFTGEPQIDMQYAALSYRKFGLFDTYLSKWRDGAVIGDQRKEELGKGIFFIVDLLEETSGFLDFDIELPFDCRIDIGYGEHLLDGRCRTAVRNFSAIYEGKQGRNHFLNPFRRFGCRYLQFFIHAPSAKIYYAGLRPTVYPVIPKAYKSGNLLRDTIYAVCENTLLQSMHEHYEDCPWREQALYCMDSRNQMLCGYYAFGEYEFPRANLELMTHGMTDVGILSICYPCGSLTKIPSFSLTYLIAMAEYIAYSGDCSLAEENYVFLQSLLGTFLKRQDATGLITSFFEPHCWNFYEWSEGLDGSLFKTYNGSTENLHEAPLNAFLSLALGNMAKIAEALGKKEDAAGYTKTATDLNDAIKERFFNAEIGLFENCLEQKTGKYNVLTNSLCLLCGAADDLDKTHLLEILACNGDIALGVPVIPDTLSMNTFRYDALLRENKEKYAQVILDEIDRNYLYMLRGGATSFWETIKGAADFNHAGSLCHGWSAMPIYYYELLNDYGHS